MQVTIVSTTLYLKSKSKKIILWILRSSLRFICRGMIALLINITNTKIYEKPFRGPVNAFHEDIVFSACANIGFPWKCMNSDNRDTLIGSIHSPGISKWSLPCLPKEIKVHGEKEMRISTVLLMLTITKILFPGTRSNLRYHTLESFSNGSTVVTVLFSTALPIHISNSYGYLHRIWRVVCLANRITTASIPKCLVLNPLRISSVLKVKFTAKNLRCSKLSRLIFIYHLPCNLVARNWIFPLW